MRLLLMHPDESTLLLVGQFQDLEYIKVAIVTLFFYDYISSLKREISSIWVGKWTTLNVLYCLSRYAPFIHFFDVMLTLLIKIPPQYCMPMFQFDLWTSSIGIAIAEVCFYLRAYALWGASRKVAVFLVALFSAMVVTGFTINAFMASTATMMKPPFYAPHFPRCILKLEAGNYSIYGWINITIVDTTLILMITYAKVRLYRSFTGDRNTLLNRIYHDALIYFLCNLLICVMSTLFYFISPSPIKAISASFGLALSNILSCKIILRLRECGNSHLLDHDITSLSTRTEPSTLRFAQRTTDVEMTDLEEA